MTDVSNFVFAIIFLVEIAARIAAAHPLRSFFLDGYLGKPFSSDSSVFEVLDLVVVAVTSATAFISFAGFDGKGANAVSSLRLLRVLAFLRRVPPLWKLLVTAFRSFWVLLFFALLLLWSILCFGSLGRGLFGSLSVESRYSFDSWAQASIEMFRQV